MCQINVVVTKNGQDASLMESVTRLEVLDDGVRLHSYFEEPMVVGGVVIKQIDFLGGKVLLAESEGADG
jgi:predicted RNA-binding protein